jgi:hypothetical protein
MTSYYCSHTAPLGEEKGDDLFWTLRAGTAMRFDNPPPDAKMVRNVGRLLTATQSKYTTDPKDVDDLVKSVVADAERMWNDAPGPHFLVAVLCRIRGNQMILLAASTWRLNTGKAFASLRLMGNTVNYSESEMAQSYRAGRRKGESPCRVLTGWVMGILREQGFLTLYIDNDGAGAGCACYVGAGEDAGFTAQLHRENRKTVDLTLKDCRKLYQNVPQGVELDVQDLVFQAKEKKA